MKNKFKIIVSVILFSFISCKSNKILNIDNRLGNCLVDNELKLLKKDKENRKNKNLYITEVHFDFEECIGIFRYEYGYSRKSVGLSNYVLKDKKGIYIQTKDKKENEKIVSIFLQENGNLFSEADKKDITFKFINVGISRGKME